MLQLFIRSTVAIYSILPIGQFFVVAQIFSLQLFAKTLATALVGEKKFARPPKIGL